MKVGDLVKHVDGVNLICPTTYSLGVVIEIQEDHFYGVGAMVHWTRGNSLGPYIYPIDELEVIHEGR